MYDGYHSEIRHFMEEIVSRGAGKPQPLPTLPPKVDIFMQSSMVYSISEVLKLLIIVELVSTWVNMPILAGKNLPTLREIKAQWTNHMAQLKTARITVPLAYSGNQ